MSEERGFAVYCAHNMGLNRRMMLEGVGIIGTLIIVLEKIIRV